MCLAIGGCDYMLLFCKPHTGIAMLKVLILCQIWRLQLEMKAVAVLITFIDKAEIFLEAGRSGGGRCKYAMDEKMKNKRSNEELGMNILCF